MSKKPIKSNLFRFITLRGPQTANEASKSIGFISFPTAKETQSKAHVAAKGASNEAEKREALKNAYAISDATVLKTRTAISAKHPDLYSFSEWLMRNKSTLSYKSILNNVKNATPLSNNSDDEIIIWNSLFHQVIHKTSEATRERLLQLLVTNQFLTSFEAFKSNLNKEGAGETVFTEDQKKEFTRRANASVIIPKEVLLSSQIHNNTSNNNLSYGAREYLKRQSKVEKAKKSLHQYQSSLRELNKAATSHNKREQKRYDAELKQYNETIAQLKKDAIPTIEIIRDPKTGFQKQEEIYPDLNLPDFNFNKAPEIYRNPKTSSALISKNQVSERLSEPDTIDDSDSFSQFSPATQQLIDSEDFRDLDTFNEVKAVLEDKIRIENQNIITYTPETTKTISVQGESIQLNIKNQIPLYTYGIDFGEGTDKHTSGISLSLKVKDIYESTLTQATYQLSNNLGNQHQGTDFKVRETRKEDDTLLINLFPNKLPIQEEIAYNFKATLTLKTGEVLEIDTSFITTFDDGSIDGRAEGIASLKGVSNGNNETSNNVILPGISQLGIADFRRVEQEICCYTPGEVSHIENIMAREHKERSTKSFNSNQSTLDKTSEKEIESLKDTSTTERNEMQTETSSVIDKDNTTNFGANASVSGGFGDYFRFGANTDYSTSSSNASTNSNLQAKNYAQEVTERALERVVQKVSTKRSSIILREFEESNTHGFDNRKSDKHINGVYRWVDKIYKNSLVNYGKRLMYEFALPEPAKFLLSPNEDDNNDISIIEAPKKPIHPKDLKNTPIKSATSIDTTNYQSLESIYNVDIDTPKDENYIINESKTGHFPKGPGALSYEAIIPEGYEATHYTVTAKGGIANGGVERHVGIYATVANTPHSEPGKKHYSHSGSLSNIKRKLPYAIHTHDIGAFTISIKATCQLSKKAIQEWQNTAYKKVLEGYNKILATYKEELKDYETKIKQQQEEIKQKEASQKNEINNSSSINRSIEKRELKRIAIGLLTQPFGIDYSKSHYSHKDGKTVIADEQFQNHVEIVKFFEQAFDWEIMAYTFYPYFYADDNNWKTLLQSPNSNDPIFKAFLQSAMARTVVPVRPGFEDAVNWYIKTGEIWNGQGMVTDIDDDLYVSIAEEMKTIQGKVEESWETRVPTSLTVLQEGTAALNEDGLPCNPDCEGNGLFDGGTFPLELDGVDFDIVGKTNTIE